MNERNNANNEATALVNNPNNIRIDQAQPSNTNNPNEQANQANGANNTLTQINRELKKKNKNTSNKFIRAVINIPKPSPTDKNTIILPFNMKTQSFIVEGIEAQKKDSKILFFRGKDKRCSFHLNPLKPNR